MAEAKIRLAVEGASLVRSELDRVNAGFDSLGSGATLLKSTLLGLVGGLSVGAFANLIRGSIDAADALNDLTQRVGVSIKDLAGYELAAKQSGTTMEAIARGIKGLGKTMSDHGDALRAAGLDAKDANGLLIQTADLFSQMPDGIEKTTLATDLFGKAGMDLIPMLNLGSKGLKEAAEKSAKYAEEMAIAAPIADKFNDLIAEIGLHSKTVGMSMLNEALPGLLAVTRAMADGSREGGVFAGVMAGISAGMLNYKKGVNDFYGAKFFDIKEPSTGGATGSWGPPEKAANDKAVTDAAEVAAKIKAIRDALKTKDGSGKGDKAEKISEYTRLTQEINKVVAAQDLELLQGRKLSASDKYQADEVQKITAAYANHKISQQERLKLIEMTSGATAKMLLLEQRSAAVKAAQFNYAEQLEFAKELADSEVSLSKAREQGREVLAEYARTVGEDNEFTALQLSLVGQTEDAKERAIALYRIELELKKQIAAINSNAGFDGEQRAESIAAAQATAASARAGVTSKAYLQDQEKLKKEQIDLWKQIDSTAESVFVDMLKNGSSAFKGLEDELKNGLYKMLYEMTIKPWIVQIGSSISGFDLSGLLGGGGKGGGLVDGLLGKGLDLLGGLFGGGGAAGAAVGTSAAGVTVSTTSIAGIEALSASAATLGSSAAAGAASVGGMGSAILGAIPGIGWLAAGATALFAIFGFGKDKVPTVLNDLSLFNNSLIGLPFLELSLSSDDAAQGLRDVLYGLDNATPTMRKLAGETVSLSIELLRASGDIAGARNLARNLGTRGMSEEEIAVYDYNEKLREQIEAHRAAASAASAGASAAQALKAAEDQLAQARYNLAGKLNILLGRTTQLEFDRATALASTTDAASIAMLTLTYQLEDMYTAVDANYAKLERSIAAEKKLVDVRLKSATDLAAALKTTRDAISPALDRSTAQSQIAMYLALAKAGGVLPSALALKPALDAIAKPSTDLFATFEEYAIDQARTANDIADLSGYADKQVSVEQQTLERLDGTLEAAKAQLDLLKGIDNSVTSVAAAVTAFQLSMETLSATKANASAFSFAAPTPSSGGGGGGGGYYGGGASAAAAAAGQYEAIAGQDNADIVAAYRAYYSRNPDASGYDYFAKSNLAGDALTQAILRASSGDVNGADYQRAIANGYDPMNPLAKFYKSKNKATAGTGGAAAIPEFANGGSHAGGLRLVGELGPELEATGASRISSTKSLLDAFRSGGQNNEALVSEIRALRVELEGLRAETRSNVNHNSKTASLLDDVINGERSINTASEVTA